MNMYDDVTKLPMTYRDSLVSCTVVMMVQMMMLQDDYSVFIHWCWKLDDSEDVDDGSVFTH